MKTNKKKTWVAWLATAALLAAVGCSSGSSTTSSGGSGDDGGGDDGGEVRGLVITDQVALVTATGTSSASISARNHTAVDYRVPTGGEYLTDEPKIYVYDKSMQALDTINEILCSIQQTQYDAMVNQGDYIALIDNSKCSQQQDQSGSSSNQSSGEQLQYETWVVNVSRTDNDSPQIVKAWIEQSGDGEHQEPFSTIRAQLTITEGVSATNPFGIFSLDFVGYSDDGEQVMTGNLSSINNSDDMVELEMNMTTTDNSMVEQTHAVMTPDGSSGQAYTHRTQTGTADGSTNPQPASASARAGDTYTFSETVNVAFDDAHYLSSFELDDGSTKSECLDRVNHNRNVWRYRIYDAAGAVKTLNGGFGIKYGENYGWAGYWGVWLPQDLTLEGLEVTKAEDDTLTYTVHQAPGRLVKHTRKEMQLSDLTNKLLQYWNPESGGMQQIRWNGSVLELVGTQTCGDTGCTFTELPEPLPISPDPFQSFFVWKEGIGDINLMADENGTFSDETEVPYYAIETVTPDDDLFASGAVTLKCYERCLKSDITTEELQAGSFYLNDSYDVDQPNTYTLDPTNMILKLDGDSVAPVSGASAEGTFNEWGMNTGSMVLSSVSLTETWEMWQQEVTYTWETGTNEWNKYTYLTDASGAIQTFDPPMNCVYSDDTNGTFLLQYAGKDELHGIPFVEISDEDSQFSHWVASFEIEDGTELDCDGTAYYTRAMEIEESMESVSASECGDLTITSVGAPTNTFTDPELPETPTVTDPPAVIGGELQ